MNAAMFYLGAIKRVYTLKCTLKKDHWTKLYLWCNAENAKFRMRKTVFRVGVGKQLSSWVQPGQAPTWVNKTTGTQLRSLMSYLGLLPSCNLRAE